MEHNLKKLIVGINRDFSNQEYHADTSWLSSSKLKLLLEDPKEFHNQVVLGNARPQSKAPHLDLGSYVHTLCLEPHLEQQEYAFFPGWRKQGAIWEAFKTAPENANKVILSVPQAEQGKLLAKALEARPEILKLISGGEPELSICSTILDVPVKMRADYLNSELGYIVDVKTTHATSGVENFREAMDSYGYGLSAALYAQIAYQHYGKLFDFYFAVVSKSDRSWDLYKASSKTLSLGMADVTQALVTYKKCIMSGVWELSDEQKEIEKELAYVVELV